MCKAPNRYLKRFNDTQENYKVGNQVHPSTLRLAQFSYQPTTRQPLKQNDANKLREDAKQRKGWETNEMLGIDKGIGGQTYFDYESSS